MPTFEQIEAFDEEFGFGAYDRCARAVERLLISSLSPTPAALCEVRPERLVCGGLSPTLAEAYCALVRRYPPPPSALLSRPASLRHRA